MGEGRKGSETLDVRREKLKEKGERQLGHPDEIRATTISLGRQMNTDYRDTKYKEY